MFSKYMNVSSRSKEPLYGKFHAMKQRCNNPKDSRYKNYGARGIKVLWETYDNFKKDMLESYLRHVETVGGGRYTTIDRINNDGPYSKENCRWSTPSEQIKNQRDIRHREKGKFAKKPK